MGDCICINEILFSDIRYDEKKQRYTCPRCKRMYKHKYILLRHLNYECGIEPQFSCKSCYFRCKRKYDLKNHYIKWHSGESTENN